MFNSDIHIAIDKTCKYFTIIKKKGSCDEILNKSTTGRTLKIAMVNLITK